ncbi:hypothetical protein J4227_06960 [Candidatus Woesearchaeota archaeon]|nr:hypothetical protein [Candidatus Woesearchaeota archaeon]
MEETVPKADGLQRKKRRKSVIASAALALMLYIIIFVMKFPYKTISTPVFDNQSYIESKQQEEECITRPYRFEDAFITNSPWKKNGTSLTPTLMLKNLEGTAGKFTVQIAFFNRDTYPWSSVNGGNPNAKVEKADIYSGKVEVTIPAGVIEEIEIMTDMHNDTDNFWAEDIITPPYLTECLSTTHYINQTRAQKVQTSWAKTRIRATIWQMATGTYEEPGIDEFTYLQT